MLCNSLEKPKTSFPSVLGPFADEFYEDELNDGQSER